MQIIALMLVSSVAAAIGLIVFLAVFVFIRKPPLGRNRFGAPSPTRGPLDAIANGLKGYFNFSGRSNRWDFFAFALVVTAVEVAVFVTFVASALYVLNGPDDTNLLAILPLIFIATSAFLLLPCLPMAVRRLHDGNRSGWWLLLLVCFGYFILLYWFLQPPSRDQSADVF